MLSESEIYYIWQPYLFLHMYDHLSSPCLADIFVSFCLFMSLPFQLYIYGSLYTMLMSRKCDVTVTNILHLATTFVLCIVKVYNMMSGICIPMLIPRQLRFSLYSGAVITEGLM